MPLNLKFVERYKMRTKALFLFAGLGGYAYPFYQSNKYEITFVEYLPELCEPLQKKYPLAKVVCEDAIKYLEQNYKDFDFIFASPPCVANSKLNLFRKFAKGQFPRLPSLLSLEIKIFLETEFNGYYIIENTKPYFRFPVEYTTVGRHIIMSNFNIPSKNIKSSRKILACIEKGRESYSIENIMRISKKLPELQGICFNNIKGIRHKQLYNNTMALEISQYLYECCDKQIREQTIQ